MRNLGSLNLIRPTDNSSIHWDIVSFERYKKIYPRFNEKDWKLVKKLLAESGALPRHQSKWFNLEIQNFLSKSTTELDYAINDDLKLINMEFDGENEKVRPVFLSQKTLSLLEEKTNIYATKHSKTKSEMKRYLVKLAIDLKAG